MDDQQRQTMNRAAQEFTEALVAAYRQASDNTAAAQQMGAQQIEYFFDAVIDNLRAQAEGTSQMARQLAGQQRLAQQTTRDLARVSTDNYMDFLDSMFSFYQGGTSRIRRRAEEARKRIEEAEARAERAEARAREAEARAEEAERARSEAEDRTGEAKRGASTAKRRATEAEKKASEAESRAEQAESRAEQAQEQSRETERSLQEAERRAEETERSEAEGRGGEEGGATQADTEADAASRPQSQWVRTSGRSKVRGRNTRARDRSSGRRR